MIAPRHRGTRRIWKAGLFFGLLAGWGPAAPVPPLGGGNVSHHQAAGRLASLRELGVGMARIPIPANVYWRNGRPRPEAVDEVTREALQQGIQVLLLFEYYTRWDGDLGGYEKWRTIGTSFAERFAPGSDWWEEQGVRDYGITFYSAINEPMWKSNNPTPIPPEAYAIALEGLADGVHSMGADLKLSPGGYQEVPLFQHRNPYLRAVAPLYNQGKLFAIDIHRYWDVDYVPMNGDYTWSLHAQFADVKKWAGIDRDVAFCTTEMNFKKRQIHEDEAARGFLTALWDALTVTGDQNRPVTAFVMPWNVFHTTAKDEQYGLCLADDPWTPTARGKVLQQVLGWTRNMDLVSTDPSGSGMTVLQGPGRQIRVWQNREGWTNRCGSSITLRNLPPGAKRLEVHTWDGLKLSRELSGEPITVDPADLPQDQTLVFVIQ